MPVFFEVPQDAEDPTQKERSDKDRRDFDKDEVDEQVKEQADSHNVVQQGHQTKAQQGEADPHHNMAAALASDPIDFLPLLREAARCTLKPQLRQGNRNQGHVQAQARVSPLYDSPDHPEPIQTATDGLGWCTVALDPPRLMAAFGTGQVCPDVLAVVQIVGHTLLGLKDGGEGDDAGEVGGEEEEEEGPLSPQPKDAPLTSPT